MARVTVEDCLDNVDNRFQLVMIVAKRARQLTMGKEPLVAWENDKATVVALREVAEGLVGRSILDKEKEEEVKVETLEELLSAVEDIPAESTPTPLFTLPPVEGIQDKTAVVEPISFDAIASVESPSVESSESVADISADQGAEQNSSPSTEQNSNESSDPSATAEESEPKP